MIAAHVVDAFTTVDAGPRQTFVQIQLAVLTLEACRTVADIGAVVVIAHTVVQARIRDTFVNVDLTVGALIAVENDKSF